MTNEQSNRMKELIELLNRAGKAYYSEGNEIMSNFEYDALYDELDSLEKETGVTMSNSPTVNVGYEVVSALPKERHPVPMLSLAKTKDREELAQWLNGHEGLLSWKLDGLTVVLSYEDGKLIKAVTRGNGEIGEVITDNVKCFANVPHSISFTGRLVIRGEALITYADFEEINRKIPDIDSKYKNPRNLCSGSVRQLDPNITKERNVKFIAFNLVEAEEVDFNNSCDKRYQFLKSQGFDVVEYKIVTESTIADTIAEFEKALPVNAFPSDGLVLTYEDVAYGQSLGRTAKFPRSAIAFKWADETAVTTLREIEWSASRTGLINPVAIFDPVELEGTTVSRASVHNLSIIKGLKLGIGDQITVYKANMIIPQIAANLTESDNLLIPKTCPVCGGKTKIEGQSDSKSLYCTNEECSAKQIKAFSLFVSRDAINIEGLSEQTLEKFIARGFITEYADIFHLDRFMSEIIEMEGFGEKSYVKLINAIETARKTNLHRFIYALGIAGIGVANAKVLSRAFGKKYDNILGASIEELSEVDGVGNIIASDIISYFADENKKLHADHVYNELDFSPDEETESSTNTLEGKVFVITGAVNHFENRSALKDFIEAHGGKTTGSVSAKTNYLINNDSSSASSKNKKAHELGVSIITEEQFLEMASE